jgi:2-oxoglutarate dehydrogenase E2 component (dihydrolipoamide succinyltransferase)
MYEIVMPRLGESVIEATITRWLKKVGEPVSEDESLAEIATDKVDSEISSPVEGWVAEMLFKEGDVVAVGSVIARVRLRDESQPQLQPDSKTTAPEENPAKPVTKEEDEASVSDEKPVLLATGNRFLSPLVKTIARTEGLSPEELDHIPGTGREGRLTKNDLLDHLAKRTSVSGHPMPSSAVVSLQKGKQGTPPAAVTTETGDEIVEMDRMRRLIADHMVMSKQVSPHVTSFIEADLTKIVRWREANKAAFEKREGTRLTFTPILFEAAVKALREFPGINASVSGNQIIIRKQIHLGMATILPNGNLIVPVIHHAGQKDIPEMARSVNDLASRARSGQLLPDEIQGGTFTITNLGSFGSLTGTPIINQPQVAILALGAIRKVPAVIETEDGDMIAVRHKMILALTYDHRVVDGGLGGLYLKRLVEILENFQVF